LHSETVRRIANRGSIRFQFFFFIGVLLTALLLLVNIYPCAATRDAVYQEKEKTMRLQAENLASSLSGLEAPDGESMAEILRLLDIRSFERVAVAAADGAAIYDSDGGTELLREEPDLQTALGGKTVFRSRYSEGSFASSFAIPFGDRDGITGAVLLRECDAERGQILNSLQTQIRVASVLIALAALVIVGVYSTTVLSKLRRLSDAIRIVAGGDYKYRMSMKGADELSELGREFNELTARLEDTEKQRRRFVADASHELKTPLASIRLLADSIVQSEGMDEATVREFVGDIGSEAERLQHMTEDLLSLSRLDDDIRVEPVPVDIRPVALKALNVLRPVAAEKDVRIETELDEGCVVPATADNMYHIVFNLMENAVKYNYPGGRVDVSLHAADGEVVFTVADTGIGIPESERFNIFGRFYRVDKARSREAGGSGLGLSIVHDAVKTHGGSISVGENTPQGSRFVVRFPQYHRS